MTPFRREVRAAGGIVLRPRPGGGVEVAVVHRPKYDDWTLPKGKLDPGETWEQAALREVEEETGLRCRLGKEVLPPTRYRDAKGRPKTVRYWLMEVAGGAFTPNREVDELRWLELPAATALLTYDHDQELLAGVAAGRPGA
jgi:8-oxo-dGTP diphosphatase